MNDLFSQKNLKASNYNAADIEVLENLEAVRLRPGMYIGGTDENALHHLFNEVIDNSIDEVGAGYANLIEVTLDKYGYVSVRDNGRGIPVDKHPKFPKKSALEVILTTLHSGGKFKKGAYNSSGGLHGVGISVVNALSEDMTVEVYRDGYLHRQTFSRGLPTSKLEKVKQAKSERGTLVKFLPDSDIFKKNKFSPERIYALARSKAYLFDNVEIRWHCDKSLLGNSNIVPENEKIKFPKGLEDFIIYLTKNDSRLCDIFHDKLDFVGGEGRIELALTWCEEGNFIRSYCNAIPTPLGGTHETGVRSAIVRAIKHYAELVGNKKVQNITSEDISATICAVISVFVPNPQFQGQTKEKLTNSEVSKLVESTVKDHFEHWLNANKASTNALIEIISAAANERLSRKSKKSNNRKTLVQKLRLPGKLSDCSQKSSENTELFLVEGDSAGGSAKQARDRALQAVMPLRGKILNIANSSQQKIENNQEISDMILALGCQPGKAYNEEDLRYEKIIIMTDADVDGAHIASLLMSFFFTFFPKLVEQGHLYIAKPPLYRVSYGDKVEYIHDEAQKIKFINKIGNKKYNLNRFKGLGEMTASQLKETTMDPKLRKIIKIILPNDITEVETMLAEIMGKNASSRLKFIQEKTEGQGVNNGKSLKDIIDV